jgi:hypothetical protein
VFAEVFRFDRVTNAMSRVADVLRPVKPDIDRRAAELREEIHQRMASLERQPRLKAPPR